MSKIRIVADSTCDLTSDLIEKHGISILPLNIVLDMTSYCDGEEIVPDEILCLGRKKNQTYTQNGGSRIRIVPLI